MPKKILFIPGKNPKPEHRLHQDLLQRSLLEGVRRHSAQTANEIEQQQAFELCAWNYAFYSEHMDFSEHIPHVEKLLKKQRASVQDKLCAKTWKIRLSRLIYQTGDQFPWLIDFLADEHVKALLEGSMQYFDNHDGRAEEARSILRACLIPYLQGDHKLLIVAHSLGSIIAYDTLYQISQLDRSAKHIDTLLTIGSPLGLKYTQQRLLAYSKTDIEQVPSNIRRWQNVSARGDLVSVDKTLADDFSLMTEAGLLEELTDHSKGVYHWYKSPLGYNFHSSYGYLVGPVTSNIICQWWQNN